MVNQYRKPIYFAVIICIFIFYSGIFTIPEQNPYFSLINKNDVSSITGKIISSPAKSSSQKTYSCKFELFSTCSKTGTKSSSKGIITVYIPSVLVEAHFPGKLYSEAKNKGGFIYETGGNYCFSGRFTNFGFIADSCSLFYWNNSFWGKVCRFRAFCRLQFKRLMYFWADGGGLLVALLCGSKEYVNPDVSNGFKDAGLSHILALSGMHLSMFSSIALMVGDKIGRKRLTYLIRFIVLCIFVWFAGFSASLLRAFICALLLLSSSIFSVDKPNMLVILCFSFLLQICISPSDIQNAGFLLSYGALAGILIFNSLFQKLFSKFTPLYLSSSLSASTSANLFTAPISLKLFGSFCPIGIIATTFVSPLITLFIYSGLILIILSLFFPPFSIPSGIFINILYTIISKMVLWFSKFPSIHL